MLLEKKKNGEIEINKEGSKMSRPAICEARKYTDN